MNQTFFKNKKVTVMGLGLNGGGVGIAKFLSLQGAKVIATDIKTKEQLKVSIDKLKGYKNIQFVLGQHRKEDFFGADMVIKNPLIPWEDKNIKLAIERKVPVEMDSSIFFKLCKNPIIGVTGTKGKTTTATLVYEILKLCGKNPIKVGIGQTSVLDKLLELKKDSIVVFELSSWRLSALGRAKLSPHIAVFKNIMPDHLNYYGTMEKYLTDKEYIYANQKSSDWLVVNMDDETLKKVSQEAKSQIVGFSFDPIKKNKSVFIDDGYIYLNDGIDVRKIVSIKDIAIPGKHNLTNVMAAIGAVFAYGVPLTQIKRALPQLKGVPHRLEFVREVDGVKYYNDTAATIPDAAISALDAFEQKVVLIAGGADKNLEFDAFARKIIKKSKGTVLLKGAATDKLLAKLEKHIDFENKQQKDFFESIEVVDSMQKAIDLAKKGSIAGDIVLLSPGAASFGIFNNEFDRGEQFRDAVRKLRGKSAGVFTKVKK